MTTTPPRCTHCHRPLRALKTRPGQYERYATGYCGPCQSRWKRQGCPPEGPPPPEYPGGTARALAMAQRAERVARARSLQAQGLPREAIAIRLGVAKDTLRRYLRTPQPKKEEGTAMPRTITSGTMPSAAHAPKEPPPPAGPGPDLAYLHGRSPTAHELDVRQAALKAAAKAESAALLSIPGRG